MWKNEVPSGRWRHLKFECHDSLTPIIQIQIQIQIQMQADMKDVCVFSESSNLNYTKKGLPALSTLNVLALLNSYTIKVHGESSDPTLLL